MGSKFPQAKRETKTATIAISTTTSNAIDITGKTLIGLIMPSALTGSTMKIQGSMDGTNYKLIKNSSGTDLSFTIAANSHIVLSSDDYQNLPARYIKLVSGSTETAERSITVITKAI